MKSKQQGLSNKVKADAMKWPTPAARDWKDTGNQDILSRMCDTNQETLPRLVAKKRNNHDVGNLNPTWVDWLMGYPLQWTDIDAERNNEAIPWETEPDIGRLTTVKKNRVQRLKGLGNAIVPQIAELLFSKIKGLL